MTLSFGQHRIRVKNTHSRSSSGISFPPASNSEFGSPTGAHPRTSGADSTAARSRSQHRSAGYSRVAPGLGLTPSQPIKTALPKTLNSQPCSWENSPDTVSKVIHCRGIQKCPHFAERPRGRKVRFQYAGCRFGLFSTFMCGTLRPSRAI
jgi:hypothetical protein